jgi:outer membrane protein OmpA-like peptidoglycan-associated protein
MKTLTLSSLGALVLFAVGCGSTVPPELVSARSAYDRASKGPSAQLNPAGLHSAKETLDAAEHSFADDGDSQDTKDLAYTAERRAQTAEARAREMQAVAQKDEIVKATQAYKDSKGQQTAAELAQAKKMLATTSVQLENEKKNREAAEKRAADAQKLLAGFATVKEEPRGMVITLSGSVLFASDKSELLGTAKTKLNQVAEALKQDGRDITVLGHTDSQGNDDYNVQLSQRRADAVRQYLVSRGVDQGKIHAEGKGEAAPIADNASPEGRANNRRVEIILDSKPQASK